MKKGTRVVLHPATDHWMRGDRYGVVVGRGHTRDYLDTFTGEVNKARPYLVLLDKSGKKVRLHPTHITEVE